MRTTKRALPTALALSLLALTSWALLPSQDQGPSPAADSALIKLLNAGDIQIDRAAGALSVPVETLVTTELLEYLLVGPEGAAHESLFVTSVKPSLLNAGLLALGVQPGQNARNEAVVPYPTEEEIRAGAEHHRMVPPSGDGVFLYLAWQEADETYFMRVEDALCDLSSQRTMRRHRWVYLGSMFQKLRADGPEVFMADEQQNLINLSFFVEGTTLATAALPECERQTIWMANNWALPPRGQPLRLIMAHKRLESLPVAFRKGLPEPDRSLPIK